MMQLTLFDYAQLDTETRIVVQQRTSEIKALMKRTAQDIIEIGEKLIEVKARLPHGAFGGWLESEFQWTSETARRFMNVADKFKNNKLLNLDSIAPSALYLLAAPSTPDDARAEAIERAGAGERITHTTAKEIVNQHKPPVAWSENNTVASVTVTDGNVYGGIATILEATPPPAVNTPPPAFNYKRDTRQTVNQNIYEPKGMDACQTPAYAIDPILPYLGQFDVIWEPAAGEGYLVEALYDSGWDDNSIETSDLIEGLNFFDYEPTTWDCLVTNPPYSLKFKWLERCYALGKPFALLLPVETLGTKSAQTLFKEFGMELIVLDKRINFKMPNKGWESSAQFPVAWFTWGLGIGEQITYAELERSDNNEM